jgi:hypothetical protein
MTANATCPLCSQRKAKRLCPALERAICPVCCGTKRLVEIRCPPSCPYLSSARSHPPAVVQRREDRDLGYFAPLFEKLTQGQYELLLAFQSLTVKHAGSAMPPLHDIDVADAAQAVAATLETSRKGIIYEHQTTSLPAQRLAADFREFLARLTEKEPAARVERNAAVALRRHEQGARGAAAALAGDAAPVYLNLLGRMMSRIRDQSEAEKGSAPTASAEEPQSSRLIIPG